MWAVFTDQPISNAELSAVLASPIKHKASVILVAEYPAALYPDGRAFVPSISDLDDSAKFLLTTLADNLGQPMTYGVTRTTNHSTSPGKPGTQQEIS